MRRFRPARRDEGAAAVEFALLFPIFMILAMGIITAGTAFSRQINITQAAREGSRYGATYDISTIAGQPDVAGRVQQWITAVDGAVRASAGASQNPITGYDYRCVAIVTTGAAGAVDPNKTWYSENGAAATPATGTRACPSTNAAAIANTTYVQVILTRNVTFNVLFISPTLQLEAVSVTPYEGTIG